MPYASQRDREIHPLEIESAPYPVAPLNFFLTSGYQPGAFDLVWDDPSQLSANRAFTIVGVNVYRSFDSEFGPFYRLTEYPVSGTLWQDRTDNEVILEEDVSDAFVVRNENQYVFRVQHFPIIKAGSQGIYASAPEDVQVFVDGQRATVLSVNGFAGEIELDPRPRPDVATQTVIPPVVPGPNSKVTCTYRRTRTLLRTELDQRVFYRVTAVGYRHLPDGGTTALVETPLERATATHNFEIEKVDWIWQEAIRRNRWILEQGGESVKLFIRKNNGLPCPCVQDRFHKQAQGDCELCYGTSFVGGFEGPFDVLIATDDAERRTSHRDIGLVLEHSYEVWTGPTPLLSMRDFIVRINGERYSIGAVRRTSVRGMVLQQNFPIAIIDEADIRYRVPVDGARVAYENYVKPTSPDLAAGHEITNKPEIPQERQLKGRTPVWENILY